tara:strand:- start:169 stop:579 length:411 start_codon:yes stop_codon:yes gene_type:complete
MDSLKKESMLYMIYSEWGDNKGCIVNFVEGEENAFMWGKHFFFQNHDSTPDYIDFHWQKINVVLDYSRDRKFHFHPNPSAYFSNGYCSTIIVPMDNELSIDELMQIPEFDASIFPWGYLIERQLEHEYLNRLIENN